MVHYYLVISYLPRDDASCCFSISQRRYSGSSKTTVSYDPRDSKEYSKAVDRLRGADQQWITVTGYGDDEEEELSLLVECGMLNPVE